MSEESVLQFQEDPRTKFAYPLGEQEPFIFYTGSLDQLNKCSHDKYFFAGVTAIIKTPLDCDGVDEQDAARNLVNFASQGLYKAVGVVMYNDPSYQGRYGLIRERDFIVGGLPIVRSA